MTMVTLKSASNSNLPQALSTENNRNNLLRDASFSSYLSVAEESFVLKLSGSSYLGKNEAEEGEIGVFDADRYFNGVMDEDSTPTMAEKSARKYQIKEDEPVSLDPIKPIIQSAGTPSVSSESSSNNQSALLQSVTRNSTRTKTNKSHGKSFFASLGCKCACSDKNSVEIDEYAVKNKFNRSDSCGGAHANGIAVAKQPIKTSLNPVEVAQITKPLSQSWVQKEMSHKKLDKFGVGGLKSLGNAKSPVKTQFQEVKQDEKMRKSLEVFGSPIWERRTKSSTIEKRLSMLSWDGNPRAEEIEIPSAINGNYDDSESDASSDLFEIESLIGRANPFLSRQSSDGMSPMSGCVTPTIGYAPSEASIEWSVITASVADFSAMSDSEELPRRRPSTLLGCKSPKVVRIAGDAYRTSEKAISDQRMQHRP